LHKDRIPRHRHPRRRRRGCRCRGMRSLRNCMCRRNVRTPDRPSIYVLASEGSWTTRRQQSQLAELLTMEVQWLLDMC